MNGKLVHVVTNSTLSWAGNIYDLLILTYVYTELARCLGATVDVSTTIVGLGLIGRVAGGYVFGRLADFHGRKPVLIASTAGYALSQAGIAFSPNLLSLFVLRAFQGFFMGGNWTTATVIAYEFSPSNLRSWINGIVQAGYGLGYALTGLSFTLFPPSEWRLFLLTGAAPLVLVPYMVLAIPRDKPIRSQRTDSKPLTLVKGDIVRATLVISGMFASYYSMFAVFNQNAEALGVSREELGIALLVANVLLAFSFLAFGRLAQKYDKKALILLGVAGEVISIPGMFGTFGADQISLWLVTYNIATGFWPLAPLLIAEIVPQNVRATVTGTAYNVGSLIGGLSSAAIGFASQATNNYFVPGLVFGYVPLAVVIGVLLSWKRSSTNTG